MKIDKDTLLKLKLVVVGLMVITLTILLELQGYGELAKMFLITMMTIAFVMLLVSGIIINFYLGGLRSRSL